VYVLVNCDECSGEPLGHRRADICTACFGVGLVEDYGRAVRRPETETVEISDPADTRSAGPRRAAPVRSPVGES
jgi:hypothetical protein